MTPGTPPSAESPRTHRVRSDLPFFTAFILLSAFYVLLIAGLITADLIEVTFEDFKAALRDEKIQYAIMLSAITCTITAILSIWVAVPTK